MSTTKRTYRITICRVCGLEAPFECEHMRAMGTTGENVYRSIEVAPVEQRQEAVSHEHAIQAIGWMSAVIAVHGAPELAPEWLELWERALIATEGQSDHEA